MRIGFFGAAREVTGSCILFETESGNFLVDCGMIQGGQACSTRNYEPFGFDVSSVKAVCVTHAHLDHHGRLPRFFNNGGSPAVYSTAPTRDLAELMLEDAYTIMTYETQKCSAEPLYAEKDLENVERAWKSVKYHERIEILDDVFVTWYNSGHVLGAAFVLIEAEGKRVVVSGDVGNDDVPILPPTEALPEKLDLILCESTYGDRLHSPTKDRLGKLRDVITRTIGRGGVLMIPAFSIERTQELLFDLNTLVEHEHIKVGPVFLDSPLGIGATHLYEKYKEELDLKFPENFSDDDFFQFPELEITETVQSSKRINDVRGSKVIIAGSGMMNAGRIKHHLLRYLDDERNGLLIIGYQAVGTLGRQIQDGESPVQIFDYSVDVRAEVSKIDSYSAHADYDKLTGWLKNGNAKHVVLVHGDQEAQDVFKEHLKRQGIEDVATPAFGDWIEV
jgi:metallo-beta-lactamase family protein